MKLLNYILTIFILLLAFNGNPKTNEIFNGLPSINVFDVDGKQVNVSTLNNDGDPFILMFWATWCAPCIRELNNVSDLYEEWQKDTGVEIYAVSIDDSRTSYKIAAFVEGKRWDFKILLDKNQELMRAMNFNMPPFTVLLNGNAEIVWTHNSYIQGDEYILEEKIKELNLNN